MYGIFTCNLPCKLPKSIGKYAILPWASEIANFVVHVGDSDRHESWSSHQTLSPWKIHRNFPKHRWTLQCFGSWKYPHCLRGKNQILRDVPSDHWKMHCVFFWGGGVQLDQELTSPQQLVFVVVLVYLSTISYPIGSMGLLSLHTTLHVPLIQPFMLGTRQNY